jgi:serine/threonine protein kinase
VVTLSAGAQVSVGDRAYLVQGEPETEPTPDRTAALRQVRALRLGPPHHQVWLRQVTVDVESPAAREEIIALRREHELLEQLNGRHRGLPRPIELVQGDGVSTLIMDWPVTGNRRDPCGTLTEFAPRPGEQVDSWQAATVCRGLAGIGSALSVLHAAQYAHRRLTPGGICWLDDWTFALRDLGDATRPARPGAGSVGYRAPEQGFRRHAQVGPWTDVFLLAAIAYHLVTGYQPIAEPPLPVRVLVPKLAAGMAEAIDAALSDDPARRPGMDRLVEALSD